MLRINIGPQKVHRIAVGLLSPFGASAWGETDHTKGRGHTKKEPPLPIRDSDYSLVTLA